jgi:hypothetical protein
MDFWLGVPVHPRTADLTPPHDISDLYRWNGRITAQRHGHIIKNTASTFTVNVIRFAIA